MNLVHSWGGWWSLRRLPWLLLSACGAGWKSRSFLPASWSCWGFLRSRPPFSYMPIIIKVHIIGRWRVLGCLFGDLCCGRVGRQLRMAWEVWLDARGDSHGSGVGAFHLRIWWKLAWEIFLLAVAYRWTACRLKACQLRAIPSCLAMARFAVAFVHPSLSWAYSSISRSPPSAPLCWSPHSPTSPPSPR